MTLFLFTPQGAAAEAVPTAASCFQSSSVQCGVDSSIRAQENPYELHPVAQRFWPMSPFQTFPMVGLIINDGWTIWCGLCTLY